MGKYPAFIKDDEDRGLVKEFLWEHYKGYKNCYKYIASNSGIDKMWGLGNNT